MNSKSVQQLDELLCARLVPHVSSGANKYSRGTVGVVGGSAIYTGAPILAALAAARSGAGYVRLVTPQCMADCARYHLISVPVSGCANDANGTFCAESLEDAKSALGKSRSLLVGPGMGTQPNTADFLNTLLECMHDRPLVLDADALNMLAGHPEMLDSRTNAMTVLTPHEGEGSRLLGRKIESRFEDACTIANMYKSTVVMKGPDTLVVSPEGKAGVMTEGGPELAKAGTGDVLGGIIAALLAQGCSAFEASALGAFIHARAGKLAARELGVHACMPEDIIVKIGPAFMSMEE